MELLKEFKKLVRDKIPEIIELNGERAKTRILSLILALVLLASLTTVFTGCKKTDGIVTLKGDTKKVDFAEYAAVLVGSPINTGEFTATYNNKVNEFTARLNTVTGSELPVGTISRQKSQPTDKEVLIGMTPRTETQEVLSTISGESADADGTGVLYAKVSGCG